MEQAGWHWSLRVALAVATAFAVDIAFTLVCLRVLSVQAFGAPGFRLTWRIAILALPVAIYALLTRCFGPRRSGERETRCRQCGYILRGISEPRCPECGERI